MKRTCILLCLAMAAACSGDAIVQPADTTEVAASATPSTPSNGWEFTARGTFVGTLDPGNLRITPGGVYIQTDYLNEFALSGMLAGTLYFAGSTRLVLRAGTGPVLATSVLFDLTGPQTGTFDCRSANLVEDYPAPGFTITGKFFSCKGTGDYENNGLMGTFANVPGTFDYDIAGVIW